MEILIVICLLVVIILLAKDKIVIRKVVRGLWQPPSSASLVLPDIMGKPKPMERLSLPSKATKGQSEEQEDVPGNFEAETKDNGFAKEIPQEELDDVFGSAVDLEEEEAEWNSSAYPNGDNGFATGVTFDELTAIGALLQKEGLEPVLKQNAVDIVQKIQGTELFNLVENSMEGASQKIAALLDKSLSARTGFSSSTLRNSGLEGFDIGEFV